jgi:WD40 repeat protein
MDASRAAEALPAAGAAPVVLEVLELSDLLALILRLAASPDALFVSTRVARNARAVAPAVRRLVWQDLIPKGKAIFKGHTDNIECCAFSPDGTRVVTASGDKAWIWDAETGALLTTLEGHTDVITSCAFSPSDKRIVRRARTRRRGSGTSRRARCW